MSRRLFLVAYDIRQPKRLRRALRVARAVASGGQKSAYECWLSEVDRHALIRQMSELLDTDDDQLAVIPLDPRRSVTTIGRALPPSDPDFFYFG